MSHSAALERFDQNESESGEILFIYIYTKWTEQILKIDTQLIFTYRKSKIGKIIKKSLKNYSKMYINGRIEIFQKSAPFILCKYI